MEVFFIFCGLCSIPLVFIIVSWATLNRMVSVLPEGVDIVSLPGSKAPARGLDTVGRANANIAVLVLPWPGATAAELADLIGWYSDQLGFHTIVATGDAQRSFHTKAHLVDAERVVAALRDYISEQSRPISFVVHLFGADGTLQLGAIYQLLSERDEYHNIICGTILDSAPVDLAGPHFKQLGAASAFNLARHSPWEFLATPVLGFGFSMCHSADAHQVRRITALLGAFENATRVGRVMVLYSGQDAVLGAAEIEHWIRQRGDNNMTSWHRFPVGRHVDLLRRHTAEYRSILVRFLRLLGDRAR